MKLTSQLFVLALPLSVAACPKSEPPGAATTSAANSVAPTKETAAPNKPCTPLKWSSEEFPTTQVKDVGGKVWDAAGSDMTGKMEKFLAVTLDTPLCAADGRSVDEIQFFQIGGSEADFNRLWNSKDLHVTALPSDGPITGEPAVAARELCAILAHR